MSTCCQRASRERKQQVPRQRQGSVGKRNPIVGMSLNTQRAGEGWRRRQEPDHRRNLGLKAAGLGSLESFIARERHCQDLLQLFVQIRELKSIDNRKMNCYVTESVL